jgi:hypothetical protein
MRHLMSLSCPHRSIRQNYSNWGILFYQRRLVSTETHDGIEKIEHQALMGAGL